MEDIGAENDEIPRLLRENSGQQVVFILSIHVANECKMSSDSSCTRISRAKLVMVL